MNTNYDKNPEYDTFLLGSSKFQKLTLSSLKWKFFILMIMCILNIKGAFWTYYLNLFPSFQKGSQFLFCSFISMPFLQLNTSFSWVGILHSRLKDIERDIQVCYYHRRRSRGGWRGRVPLNIVYGWICPIRKLHCIAAVRAEKNYNCTDHFILWLTQLLTVLAHGTSG